MPRAQKITKPVQTVQDVNRKTARSRTDADAFKLFQEPVLSLSKGSIAALRSSRQTRSR